MTSLLGLLDSKPLCPLQRFSDVTAASRSLGNEVGATGAAAAQVMAHRHRPVRGREGW